MGRRKKEPKSVHREHITAAASALFTQKGITATSMDDIAKAAGYSKSTLYVYFENKAEAKRASTTTFAPSYIMHPWPQILIIRRVGK